MTLRLLYAAVIACFMLVHYIALRQIDAAAADHVTTAPAMTQPTD
jgi:hypothetical protein